MGREVTINADMIIVQGVKKYRGMKVDEDLFPKGHVDVLLSKKQLLLDGAEVATATIKPYEEITVTELKKFLDGKNINYPSNAKKLDLYELYKSNA